MIEPRSVKRKWLHIRLNDAEYAKVESFWKATTTASLSEYCRNVILLKPVMVNYRNQSLDELLNELVKLKNELNAIGKNYNQSVKRLHTLYNLEEFKGWIALDEINRHLLTGKLDEIKAFMTELSRAWSPK